MIRRDVAFYLLFTTLALCLLVAGVSSVEAQTDEVATNIPEGYKLLYSQTFDEPDSLDDFVFTDTSAWQHSRDSSGSVLELVKQSSYEPPYRSPINIALIKELQFKDFVMEVDLLQTGRVYNHQDMCLYFGFKNPSDFYYTHIAVTPDDNAHNIFLVNELPRTNIAENPEEGVTWGSNVWHKIRLERDTKSGSIKVYFDDMETPIIEASDSSFLEGYIGFGSFDDVGKVDNIKIWGSEANREPTAFFESKQSPALQN